MKKLKQPKKRKAKEGSKEGQGQVEEGKEEDEDEEEKEDEGEQGGVSSLAIVKSAGEAWERLRERLKEAPIIQVRPEDETSRKD